MREKEPSHRGTEASPGAEQNSRGRQSAKSVGAKEQVQETTWGKTHVTGHKLAKSPGWLWGWSEHDKATALRDWKLQCHRGPGEEEEVPGDRGMEGPRHTQADAQTSDKSRAQGRGPFTHP